MVQASFRQASGTLQVKQKSIHKCESEPVQEKKSKTNFQSALLFRLKLQQTTKPVPESNRGCNQAEKKILM